MTERGVICSFEGLCMWSYWSWCSCDLAGCCLSGCARSRSAEWAQVLLGSLSRSLPMGGSRGRWAGIMCSSVAPCLRLRSGGTLGKFCLTSPLAACLSLGTFESPGITGSSSVGSLSLSLTSASTSAFRYISLLSEQDLSFSSTRWTWSQCVIGWAVSSNCALLGSFP